MKENVSNDQIIKDHYKIQAGKHKGSATSTMEDLTTRQKEVNLIQNFFRTPAIKNKCKEVLEIGCGNGYTLSLLTSEFPDYNFLGLDFSEDLLKIANDRQLSGARFEQGDVRKLRFEDNSFDVVFTERCIINLLSWEEQQQGLNEMHRVLKKGGYILFIESFSDGYNNLNIARNQMGLESIPMPHHNLYFEKEAFETFVSKKFSVLQSGDLGAGTEFPVHQNFLSSHYFVARVIHPLLTKGDPTIRNTEFVKFFSFLPPSGCYSPIEAYILQKK
ncbi:MAG: class I SAM-dependent methyltransferase [Bacteroidetes bacterium]|nr:class I SAM-dependent methyltransferase [Bacteroidota bacterium]MBS1930851.1 class I SAM-dependent methyltransferase [Bacteroidota bacterium]